MLLWESEDGWLRWRAVRVSNAAGAEIEYSIDGEPFHSLGAEKKTKERIHANDKNKAGKRLQA